MSGVIIEAFKRNRNTQFLLDQYENVEVLEILQEVENSYYS